MTSPRVTLFSPRKKFNNGWVFVIVEEKGVKKCPALDFDKERLLKQLKMKTNALNFDKERHLKQLKMRRHVFTLTMN